MNISDQSILITGGASGIGRHLAEHCVRVARHVTVIDKNHAALEETKNGLGVQTVNCDLSQGDDVAAAISDLYRSENAPTVLLNNAGWIQSEPLVALSSAPDRRESMETWHRVIETNLSSVFYVTLCVAQEMVERRMKGLIINMSSISAAGNVGQSGYSAAKAGVNALTVTWSKELGMFGIRVVGIAPGFIDTDSTRTALTEAQLRRWKKSTPLGRLGRVEEVARTVQFLIETDFISGRIVELDGGLRI